MKVEHEDLLHLFSNVIGGLIAHPETEIPHLDDEAKWELLTSRAWAITRQAAQKFEAETSR